MTSKGLRAGQQELAGRGPPRIDRALQVPQEPWGILDLVDHQRRRMAFEKPRRLAFGLLRLAGQIQAHVGILRKQPAHQRGLPCLPRPGEHHDRTRPHTLLKNRLDQAGDPHRANYTTKSHDLQATT